MGATAMTPAPTSAMPTFIYGLTTACMTGLSAVVCGMRRNVPEVINGMDIFSKELSGLFILANLNR
jgi:hypothetical protein